MCGIIGYVGKQNALPIIVNGLKKLEYRGYDSAGISTNADQIYIYKGVGNINDLEKFLPELPGKLGIGHTRWATHGGVNEINAHPHVSKNGNIAIVHNGIIENFENIRQQLMRDGITCKSETDSEVVAHLIEKYYNDDIEDATIKALNEIEGSYALAVICKDEKSKLVVARKGNPIIIGRGEEGSFAASDIPALIDYTNNFYYLDDNEIAILSENNVLFKDFNGNEIKKLKNTVTWNSRDIDRLGFKHFMLKEIFEQPKAIQQSFMGRFSEMNGEIFFDELKNDIDFFSTIDNISIIACGTSYYAGLYGKFIIEGCSEIPVSVELASEFRMVTNHIDKKLVIAITQSGETADTLSAIQQAKEVGCKVIVITNMPCSTASRIADWTIITRAGPEIGVAATKTFTTQLIILYLLGIYFGQQNGILSINERYKLIENIKNLPHKVQDILNNDTEIRELGNKIKDANNMFFIGRKMNYPIALEGALKLKEISYIHAEGYAAGELKHGPFALLTRNTPVVSLCNKNNSYEKMLSTVMEVKARDSPIIAISDNDDYEITKFVDYTLRVPVSSQELTPLINTVACQLFAYHIADIKNCSIDKPRNLAKSVTVE